MRLTAIGACPRGRLLRRTGSLLPEGPYYLARGPLDQGQTFELAGWKPLPAAPDIDVWAEALLGTSHGAELITCADPGSSDFRHASIIDDRLQCMSLSGALGDPPASERSCGRGARRGDVACGAPRAARRSGRHRCGGSRRPRALPLLRGRPPRALSRDCRWTADQPGRDRRSTRRRQQLRVLRSRTAQILRDAQRGGVPTA